MSEIDLRIVKISIEVDGKLETFQNLAIIANGTKFANPLQNECQVTIFNLKKSTQDYILSQTSPYNLNRTPKTLILEAGRESYGTTKIYTGNIIYSNATQPPDIGVVLKCLTGNFLKGNILSNNFGAIVPLSVIAKQIAVDLKTVLNFQATDKNIANYSFSGGSLKQIAQLAQVGGINAFMDDDNLVVKNTNAALRGAEKLISSEIGMIGIPEMSEQGLKVKFLVDNKTKLGGLLRIKSAIYPATNGDYIIYKLGFEITNRDVPFYYTAEGVRIF